MKQQKLSKVKETEQYLQKTIRCFGERSNIAMVYLPILCIHIYTKYIQLDIPPTNTCQHPMPSEYYAVIFHFTPRTFRLGFAGEPEPHVDLTPDSPLWKRFISNSSTQRQYPGFLETESHALDSSDRKDLVDAIERRPDLHTMVEHYNADYQDTRWTVWHHNDYKDLARLLKHCVARELLISPALCKLFVVDGDYLAVQKFVVSNALLMHKICASISFLPHSLMCAVASSVEDAIVVHIDWHDCSVSVVSDLRSILDNSYPDFTLETVHYNLAGGNAGFEAIDALIGAALRKDKLHLEELDMEHPLNMVLSSECLPSEIASTIMGLGLDTRPKVVQNVIFLGAVAKIPGFKATFLSQLRRMLPTMAVSGKQCLGAWAGASLYCLTTLLRMEKSKWKHKEIYKDKLDTEAWKGFVEM